MTQNQRIIERRYDDPVDLIWLHLADQIGIRIERDDEVFASWDGQGTLRIGKDALDQDDCLAQMILHELCHYFVEGFESWNEPDWGLNGEDPKDRSHEFATLRLQASLADEVSLRKFFAATTVFREYYDALPTDLNQELPGTHQQNDRPAVHEFETIKPVSPSEDRQAIRFYRSARSRFEQTAWAPALQHALRLTREVHLVVRELAPANSTWSGS